MDNFTFFNSIMRLHATQHGYRHDILGEGGAVSFSLTRPISKNSIQKICKLTFKSPKIILSKFLKYYFFLILVF